MSVHIACAPLQTPSIFQNISLFYSIHYCLIMNINIFIDYICKERKKHYFFGFGQAYLSINSLRRQIHVICSLRYLTNLMQLHLQHNPHNLTPTFFLDYLDVCNSRGTTKQRRCEHPTTLAPVLH